MKSVKDYINQLYIFTIMLFSATGVMTQNQDPVGLVLAGHTPD